MIEVEVIVTELALTPITSVADLTAFFDSLEVRLNIGDVVTQVGYPGQLFEVVGFWRGMARLFHAATETNHVAPCSELTVF